MGRRGACHLLCPPGLKTGRNAPVGPNRDFTKLAKTGGSGVWKLGAGVVPGRDHYQLTIRRGPLPTRVSSELTKVSGKLARVSSELTRVSSVLQGFCSYTYSGILFLVKETLLMTG